MEGCLRQHRIAHLCERMQYLNPKFNAHHDTKEVSEEKLRMVKERLGLFKEEGIDDEEVERTLIQLE